MSPDETPHVEGTPPSFQLGRIATMRSSFRVIDRIQTDEPKPVQIQMELSLKVTVSMADPANDALVQLEANVKPDARFQPYDISVTLAAEFHGPSATRAEFRDFCFQAAPAIMFPYVREYIGRVSADGPNGRVNLNPVNVASVLAQSGWQETKPASSVQLQPSEQSPSAEPDSKI